MNVFADLHQDDLYYSLYLLFERRLGWRLFRPIGFDWWKNGFWKYNPDTRVVQQYLQIRNNDKNLGEYYECPESKHNYSHRALTFEQFKQMDVGIVIASVRQHEEVYDRLIREYKPGAKLIREVGNIHDIVDPNICRNIMAAAYLSEIPKNTNVVIYHQEFDLNTFCYKPPANNNKITNLMNCVPASRDFELWPKYKNELKEFDWKMHGILGEDGIIGTDKGVAQAIHDSTFIWHVKFGGDGFGHVIHNAFACGRPPIVKGSYYADKIAGHLFEDGVTCIDLEKGSFEENVKKIRYWANPENYAKMSKAAYDRFCENVNFDKEFVYIKKFLANLAPQSP